MISSKSLVRKDQAFKIFIIQSEPILSDLRPVTLLIFPSESPGESLFSSRTSDGNSSDSRSVASLTFFIMEKSTSVHLSLSRTQKTPTFSEDG